jgi:NADH-ubiquinone oxidoreductase chain 5
MRFFVFFFYFLVLVWFIFNLGLQILFWKIFRFFNLGRGTEKVFLFVLFLIVFTVIGFNLYYLSNDSKLNYYLTLLLIFIVRIIILNFSFNIIMLLVSWDLLGISRFFLVIFYNNWDRNRGALNTVLTNRLGDFFLFIFFVFILVKGESLNFSNFFIFSIIFLILGSFTKSAIFPFSGWLPKAIRAPTPISSLVHRRTLVTAGLILLIKFKFLLKLEVLLKFLFFFGLITIGFSSVSALFEVDIKKIIALRTLSQMGFIIIIIGFGLNFLVFLHLISHALFKSLLFIQIGFLIHNSIGGQDLRFYKNLKNLSVFVKFRILLTLFSLAGLFFSRGLVRKDLILEILLRQNFFFIFLIWIVMIIYLTYFYSLRLFKGLLKSFNSGLFLLENTIVFNFLCLMLFLRAFFFIWFMGKNFFFIPVIFLLIDVFIPMLYFFLFFYIFKLVLRGLLFIIKQRFLSDFFPKVFNFISIKKFNFWFLDLNLFFLNLKVLNNFYFFNIKVLNYLKFNNFSFIVFLIIFIFIIF